jgi:hypothetical protein
MEESPGRPYVPFVLAGVFLFHIDPEEESCGSMFESAVSYEDAIDVDEEEEVTVPGAAV